MLEPEIGYRQSLKLLERFDQKHVEALIFIECLLLFSNIRRNEPDGLKGLSQEMLACGLTLEHMYNVSDFSSFRTIETVIERPYSGFWKSSLEH